MLEKEFEIKFLENCINYNRRMIYSYEVDNIYQTTKEEYNSMKKELQKRQKQLSDLLKTIDNQ